MLFYYVLLLDHLNDSSRIISLHVMKKRLGFYDVIKKWKGNSSGEKSNNKGLVYQVALCTYWGICLLVRERDVPFLLFRAAQHWHIWGMQWSLAPLLWWNGRSSFIPLHPWQDLFVCNKAEPPDSKWDLIGRFYPDLSRDTVILVFFHLNGATEGPDTSSVALRSKKWNKNLCR